MIADRSTARLVALRSDVIRVAQIVGKPEGVAPSEPEYDRHGRISVYRLARMATRGRSRRYTDAVRALGFTPAGEARAATRERVERDLRRVAQLCGRPGTMPSPTEYAKHGRWSVPTVYAVLAGGRCEWHAAAREAALRPKLRTRRRGETRETVVERIRAYCEEKGYQPGEVGPTTRELLSAGVVSSSVCQRLWGSLGRAIEAAGYRPHRRSAYTTHSTER